MQSYLSGRGANVDDSESEQTDGSFSSYLSDPNKQQSNLPTNESSQSDVSSESEVIHADESGIKIEVISVDGVPKNLLVHIPDGRIIDLSCEY
jgi:hypothetical protein